MGLKDDIKNKVKKILDDNFEVIDIKYIPRLDDTQLTFGNKGLKFTASVLFIDMRESTVLLNNHNKTTVAKIHMSFFHTILKIANNHDGHVRSFNGDSALIFFHGNYISTMSKAIQCAMQIKYMLSNENGIRKQLEKYTTLDFGIGIDHGEILCTKIGVAGEHNRDIFWIGNAVNKSTILGDQSRSPKHISISKYLYDNLEDKVKYSTSSSTGVKVDIWKESTFLYNGMKQKYYSTTFHWNVS